MPITVSKADVADIAEIVHVDYIAFLDDPIVGKLMSEVLPAVELEYQTRRFHHAFERKHLDGSRFYKAVDENGKMVGYAHWEYPYTLTEEQKAEKQALEEAKKNNPPPEGTNIKLMDELFGGLNTRRDSNIDRSKEYLLHLLAILPTHQRLGVGTLLIQRGLSDADANGAVTYIEASSSGLSLYQRLGWKQFDELFIDMGKFGGEGIFGLPIMKREPKTAS